MFVKVCLQTLTADYIRCWSVCQILSNREPQNNTLFTLYLSVRTNIEVGLLIMDLAIFVLNETPEFWKKKYLICFREWSAIIVVYGSLINRWAKRSSINISWWRRLYSLHDYQINPGCLLDLAMEYRLPTLDKHPIYIYQNSVYSFLFLCINVRELLVSTTPTKQNKSLNNLFFIFCSFSYCILRSDDYDLIMQF